MIVLTVPGIPIGKGRPRFARAGKFVTVYTPKKTEEYSETIAIEAKLQMAGRNLLEGALSVQIEAIFPIPKSWPKKKREECLSQKVPHTAKPDADNTSKLALDALNGIVYKDDSAIAELIVRKWYGDFPKITIAIASLNQEWKCEIAN